MPLQEVTPESGCLRFVPRSHLHPMLAHRCLNDDPRVHALEAIDPDVSHAVTCPLPAGGATVHHYRTLHGSGPNTGPRPRRAYALVYCVASNEIRVRQEYPWNAGKHTARHDRALATRTPTQRLRAAMHATRARWL